ncbi:conserved hypothetical membrane protein [Mycobacterium marinum M]|uniref:Conserved hypothetical membrane protein n=2 Tax=Mycobacterium ulcerans group TaxID=2993898 RepID=B2HJR1_MYCMM|nr:conserved hypothetical membrane protein [Mycobacterium ulcerans Agy99]ACC40297.1 conserved hypothetical membrane protein [Mycobacterium marinum M]
MFLRGPNKPTRWQSAIAVVAGLCLFAAVIGCWALRSGVAAATPSHPAATASAAGLSRADIDKPSVRSTGHQRSSSTGHSPCKSAGLKRDRPPTWSRSAPPQWWLSTPASLTTAGHPLRALRARAPLAAAAGRAYLNQLCVARC